MATVVMFVGLLIALTGVIGLLAKGWLLSLADWRTRKLVWIGAGVRVGLGSIFWLAAPETKSPLAFQILGGVFVAAGVVLLLLPLSTWRSLIDWLMGMPAVMFRAVAVFAMLFGLAIAYAA